MQKDLLVVDDCIFVAEHQPRRLSQTLWREPARRGYFHDAAGSY